METCYRCGRIPEDEFQAVGADAEVYVLCGDCAAQLVLESRQLDPGAVARGDQLAAGIRRKGSVTASVDELLACHHTEADIDALFDRKEAEARMLREMEP